MLAQKVEFSASFFNKDKEWADILTPETFRLKKVGKSNKTVLNLNFPAQTKKTPIRSFPKRVRNFFITLSNSDQKIPNKNIL